MISTPVLTAVVSLVGLAGVLTWRVREGRSAVTLKKIVMPPLGMATGFCMFFYPPCRVPFLWGSPLFSSARSFSPTRCCSPLTSIGTAAKFA